MSADAPNRLDAPKTAPRARAGDVPDEVARRYFTDSKGGPGLAFHRDATSRTPAFRDTGRRLTASRNDPHVIRDLLAIARHRGWSGLQVRGEAAFRREVWLQAQAQGLEVRGYAPTPRDRQALDRRRPAPERPELQPPQVPGATAARVVEAVVRERVADRPAQARLLAEARARIAEWLREAPARRFDDAPQRQR